MIELPTGDQFKAGISAMSPLLLAMGSNMTMAPHQRDPRAMQSGLAAMMQMQQSQEERAQREQMRRALYGEPVQTAGGFNPNAPAPTQGGLIGQMGLDPRMAQLLRALPPEQAAQTILGQMMPRQQQTEFERLLEALPPEQRQEAILRRAQLAPSADAVLRSGASERDPIAALRARAAEAGLRPGTPEYAQFMMQGGSQSGLAVEMGPDGTMSVRQGAGAAMQRPFTEGQSKDNVYTTRATGALATLDRLAPALASFGDKVMDADPTGLVRGNFQSPEYQVARTAADEFLQAILRKDTGAAITSQEQELYGRTYLPQPGDGPEQLAYKTQARRRAIAAMRAGMSPAQMIAVEKGLSESTPDTPPNPVQQQLQALDNETLLRLLQGGQ